MFLGVYYCQVLTKLPTSFQKLEKISANMILLASILNPDFQPSQHQLYLPEFTGAGRGDWSRWNSVFALTVDSR
jgi:hypothetical protein